MPPESYRALFAARLRQDILRTAADLALGLMGVFAILLAFYCLWVVTP